MHRRFLLPIVSAIGLAVACPVMAQSGGGDSGSTRSTPSAPAGSTAADQHAGTYTGPANAQNNRTDSGTPDARSGVGVKRTDWSGGSATTNGVGTAPGTSTRTTATTGSSAKVR